MKVENKTDTLKATGREQSLEKIIIVGLLLISLALFSVLKIETDKVLRKKVPGSSIIYLPSGKYLKYATFGYSSLVADLIYIWPSSTTVHSISPTASTILNIFFLLSLSLTRNTSILTKWAR